MEENHPRRFRGNFVRPEIFDLVERGTISPTEAWVLLMIDNLVDRNGKDCFASNAWFAKKIHRKERQVSEMITKLRDLGLLIQTGFDGRKRFLATYWDVNDYNPQPSGKPLGCLAENREDNKRPLKGSLKKVNSRRTKPSRGRDSKTSLPRWTKKLTNRLSSTIQSVRSVNPKTSTWPNTFRLLHEKDRVPKKRIRKVLKWYCSHIKESGDLIRSNGFVPVAYSASSFREKFLRIEDAMNRENVSTPPQVSLNDNQRALAEKVEKLFKKKAIAETHNLPALIVALGDWWNRVLGRMDRLIKEGKKRTTLPNGLERKSPLFSAGKDAERFKEQMMPFWSGTRYFTWMAEEIAEWPQWSGRIDEFRPGGKHFTRYAKLAEDRATVEGLLAAVWQEFNRE